MRFTLFCQNPYAFGILEPVMQVLKHRNHQYIWFVTKKLAPNFPFPQEPVTSSLGQLQQFKSDAILCPGNEVPHFLRGLKVQIFHGLAGEKKGHFRIRHYFDLYLTQGPYFTRRFKELSRKHKDFEVIETGWPKLDIYGKAADRYLNEKKELLQKHQANHLILYAPTFSPSLTSAPHLLKEIESLATDKRYLIQIKFHDLMAPELIAQYQTLCDKLPNVILEEEPNIVKFLLMADLMISDTSSVVYEFLLLDKPVVTFRNSSKKIMWDDSREYKGLDAKVQENLEQDPFRSQRLHIIEEYHPYTDGRSSERMVQAIEEHISSTGIPEKRQLSFLRRRKINKLFRPEKDF